MPIVTDGPSLEPENKGIDEFHVGRMDSLGATVGEAVSDLPTVQLSGMIQTERAKGTLPDFGELATGQATPGLADENKIAAATPRMDIMEANDRVKKAGLAPHLKLPDQPDIPPAQLEIMMSRAQARREREATLERGPQGVIQSALGVGTSFLVGAVDPINVASAFIPVMGELRYAKLLEAAGEGFGARLAVRAGVGGAQGAVGQAALEPLDWWSHTQDGRDFGMADVLHNILFGAVFGGAMHAGGGAVSDVYRSRTGKALYPFGPGEPLENVQGTHLPADVLHEDGITPDALEQHLAGRATEPSNAEIEHLIAKVQDQLGPAHEPIFPESPGDAHVTAAALAAEHQASRPEIPSAAVQTIDDLPQRAKEDAARAGIANLIDGEPLRVGEMLEAAAQSDPRIAESFEAWHGSPHDFDRFDVSRIGTGEGAQSFGHGLYFAENEKVALGYQRTTSERDFIRKAQELYSEGDSPDDAHAAIVESKDFTPAQKRLLLALEKDDWLGFEYPHQAVSAALGRNAARDFEMSPETLAAIKAVGNMYQVRIKASHEHLLDWDKPLSEQPQALAAFEKVWRETGEPPEAWRAMSAAAAYDRLAKHIGGDGASSALAEAGVPGIRYLDQGSRGSNAAQLERSIEEAQQNIRNLREEAERNKNNAQMLPEFFDSIELGIKDQQGKIDHWTEIAKQEKPATRNFVVFDDKHIEIVNKNGEPVNRQQFLEERAAARATDARPHRQGRLSDQPGNDNRPTAADALDRDAAWRQLSHATPEVDDPTIIAASNAAQEVKRPPTKLDERLTAAEKADAYAQQMYDMFKDRIPEEDRQRLDDLIKTIDSDHEAREIAIKQGGACLFGARA